MMQGLLKDADARQRDKEVIRVLVAEIGDAAYDLEDVSENFALKAHNIRDIRESSGYTLMRGSNN
ncbi:unnamed protein product [Malus baccata var. baccata]